jgi:hypothetical protein
VTKLGRRESRAEMKFLFAPLRVLSVTADVLLEENTRIFLIFRQMGVLLRFYCDE